MTAAAFPRIKRDTVKIKPAVSRAHHWGPIRRLRAAARIEKTALLMHAAATLQLGERERG